MPPEALAHEALTRLAHGDAAATCADLGLEHGAHGVKQALGHLRDSLHEERRPDVVLDLFRRRLTAALPEQRSDRRAALMTLMMAHGTARRHVRVPFDHAALALLE